jgi:DNA repair protein RadC
MEEPDLFAWPAGKERALWRGASEWKIVSLRETAPELPPCEKPGAAVDYWQQHIASGPSFNPDVECFVALMLNTKHRVRGHYIVSVGSLNETLAYPREVFRTAVIGAAYAIVLMHNHPSGDPSPSEADHRATRRFVEAGELLRIALKDHIIIGECPTPYFSFREHGLL